MADEFMNAPEAAPESAPAPESTVPNGGAPQMGAPSDFGAGPDTTGLPPEQANAFAKRWTAEKQKLESSVRQQLEMQYQQRLAEMQPAPPPPPEVADDAEELAQINQEILAQFYDNPLQAMQRAQEILGERKAAREQAVQAQWDYHARLMARKYPDWAEQVPRIQEFIKTHPDVVERPEHLDRAYRLAKDFAPVNPDSFLQDPAFMEKARAQIQDQIIQEYVAGKRQVQAAAPIMGGSPGGSAPAMPPQSPKTWAEAKRAASARFGG